MTLDKIYGKCKELGISISLSPDGTKIRCKAKNKPPKEFIQLLRQHKPQLVESLKANRNYRIWECRGCPKFKLQEGLCVLEFGEHVSMIPICHLRNCPLRDPQVRAAIKNNDVTGWLDRDSTELSLE